MTAGNLALEYQGPLVKTKYADAGNYRQNLHFRCDQGEGHTMNANAVALRPPAISSTTPKSQVIRETSDQ
jgi:hypothetical protein